MKISLKRTLLKRGVSAGALQQILRGFGPSPLRAFKLSGQGWHFFVENNGQVYARKGTETIVFSTSGIEEKSS